MTKMDENVSLVGRNSEDQGGKPGEGNENGESSGKMGRRNVMLCS